jgi:hypothetical protein
VQFEHRLASVQFATASIGALIAVSTEAANTSFHEMTKTKIAVAATPGSASGSTTCKNAHRPAAEHPGSLFELPRSAETGSPRRIKPTVRGNARIATRKARVSKIKRQ